MNWTDHRRWAEKFGIDGGAAVYVNRIIDGSDKGTLPDEYKRAVTASAEKIATNRGAKNGNSALALVIAEETMTHDSGRRKTTRGDLAAECTLEHLRQKGDDFVDAWYLHHHLDYLCEQSVSEDSLEEVITRYRTEYPQTYSQRIEEFLLNRAEELCDELN